MTRFVVVHGSLTAHCCFRATVVDTTSPHLIRGVPYAPNGVQEYEEVCECLEAADAELIAAALNATVQP